MINEKYPAMFPAAFFVKKNNIMGIADIKALIIIVVVSKRVVLQADKLCHSVKDSSRRRK